MEGWVSATEWMGGCVRGWMDGSLSIPNQVSLALHWTSFMFNRLCGLIFLITNWLTEARVHERRTRIY